MSEVQATISDNKKKVISDGRLNIDNYESMTLEEQLNYTYELFAHGLYGADYKKYINTSRCNKR